jgi:hypothetical protein
MKNKVLVIIIIIIVKVFVNYLSHFCYNKYKLNNLIISLSFNNKAIHKMISIIDSILLKDFFISKAKFDFK